jgi:hypothetical protein
MKVLERSQSGGVSGKEYYYQLRMTSIRTDIKGDVGKMEGNL